MPISRLFGAVLMASGTFSSTSARRTLPANRITDSVFPHDFGPRISVDYKEYNFFIPDINTLKLRDVLLSSDKCGAMLREPMIC
ncbi:hypothetical protein R80B4_00273 [Fibrobacteres bacterium R8-0-B4]